MRQKKVDLRERLTGKHRHRTPKAIASRHLGHAFRRFLDAMKGEFATSSIKEFFIVVFPQGRFPRIQLSNCLGNRENHATESERRAETSFRDDNSNKSKTAFRPAAETTFRDTSEQQPDVVISASAITLSRIQVSVPRSSEMHPFGTAMATRVKGGVAQRRKT